MKRIEERKLETPEAPSLEELIKNTGNLNIEDNFQRLGFIINPIMYVSGKESEDSSDEGYDKGWGMEKFDSNDKYKFPYRTFKIEKAKTKKDKDKIIKFNGFIKEETNKKNLLKTRILD